MFQCDDGAIPEWRFLRVENGVDIGAPCPVCDIQVGHNVTCHHDLHPNRQFDGFW
ncbi:hypothetical protein BDM02DRAFT_3116477 [Thelephora ganbajun]|uniref:Uncharacterized protein n=1 Tax=Thelephora ganbajun TaxID=370292 RepID=A0ACB6ZEJ6_THEGA|nr:hypothetical protein BDM02DRAFT_3116477 [Thelephora ganbajun]